MQIKVVTYSALLSLGNYQNERIGFQVRLDEGETAEQAIEALRQKVCDVGGTNADIMYRQMRDRRDELAEIERKIKKATEEWNATAEFLRTQGIKPEAPNMPQLTNLLPSIKAENVEVLDAELYGEFVETEHENAEDS